MTTMLFRLLALQIVLLGLISIAECRSKLDPYDFHLEAEHESLTGHISYDAEKGSKVKAEVEEPVGHAEGEDSKGDVYLKVHIKQVEKTLPPGRRTSTKTSDITMVTPSQTIGQETHDNLNTASSTFNHVPSHTSHLTGSKVTTNHITGRRTSPIAQKFTSNTRDVTDASHPKITDDEVTVVTKPHTGIHNVHITTGSTGPSDSMEKRFRNVIPHGHNIHITHLLHDPVHPAVNKRSIKEHSDINNSQRKRKLRHRQRRNFAVPPKDFQPQHLQTTTAKPPQLVVKGTNAFLVDPVDNYIRVNDTSSIGDHTFIQFYVVLEDDEGVVLSNPLPFIVHIDQPSESDSYPVVPAVFAGVLVLCVIFLAVFIPLVTRAKRRYKEGKPMFKLGSHPSRADLEKAAIGSQANLGNLARNPSEPNWYGNNIYYNYEDEVAKERLEFTRGLRQYSTKSEPPTLQLSKKKKEPMSGSSSSSGIDSASQGANGYDGEDGISQRL